MTVVLDVNFRVRSLLLSTKVVADGKLNGSILITSSRANAVVPTALALSRFKSRAIGHSVCQLFMLGEIPMRLDDCRVNANVSLLLLRGCYRYDVNDIIYSCGL